MRIEVYSSLGAAEKAWRDLESRGDLYVFQTFDWVASWYEYVGSGLTLEPCPALVLDDAGQALMLLPLGIELQFGLRHLVWMPTTTADYRGPILSKGWPLSPEAGNFKAFWSKVADALPPFDVIDFKNQLELQGAQKNPFVHDRAVAHSFQAHHSCLAGEWESYYRGKAKSKTRERDRSKERRLRKLGDVQISRPMQAVDITRVVDEMIAQKRAQYAAMGADDVFKITGHREFYTEMAQRFGRDGCIHLSALALDDQILATHWGAVYRGRFYYLMLAYDAGETAKFSPGSILLRNLLEWSFSQAVEIFDFTIGNESYKDAWCENHLPVYRWMQGRSFKGKLYISLKDMALRAKALRKKIRQMRR